MPELKFSCPQCGQHLQCDTGYAGAQINCPGCQQPITVPQPPVASAARLGTAPVAQRPAGAALPAKRKKNAIKAKTAIAIAIGIIVATGLTAIVIKEMTSPKHQNFANNGTDATVAPKEVTSSKPAAGPLPQTLEELNAWYMEQPAGQNAATFILQGVNAMQLGGAEQNVNLPFLGKLPPPEPSAPLSPAVKTSLADFLQRNQSALQLFAGAGQYEQSRYPVDLTKGEDTLLPHLLGLKKGGQLCRMAAILDAENGDGKKAGDDVATALVLAHSLKAEPLFISQLVRIADIALAMAALNQSVNRTTLPPESLSALAKMFRNMEKYDARGEGFNRAMVGEKVFLLAMLNDRKQLLRLVAKDQRLADYVNKDENLRAEQAYTESAFQQLIAAHQAPFPERVKNVSDVIHNRVSEARDQGHLIFAMLWATLNNLPAKEAINVANIRLAMTAIALEQFRATHGNSYPEGLSGLAPNYLAAPLMDPFDGQSLRYRKQGAGYVLYSIGPDLKDDGGKGMKAKEPVFAVVKPPAN